MPQSSGANEYLRTLGAVLKTVLAYIGGQLLIAVIMIVFYGIAFWLLDLPLWFLLAPVCGLMHIVPLVGGLIAVSIPLLTVAIAGTTWEQVAWILGIYAAAQIIEGFVLTPLIHGTRLRLHPALIFVTVLVASALFGFFGALVAVPVLAVAALLWRTLSDRDRRTNTTTQQQR